MSTKKNLILGFCFLSLISCNEGSNSGKAESAASPAKPAAKDSSKKSIPAQTVQSIGDAEIKINYYSPGVRGRVIWGGLVPYSTVWVTGAHRATSIESEESFVMGGTTVPAGKYALFTIPEKEEWTVILNKNWDQHLADDYSEGDDLVRIKVKPQTTDSLVERLRYDIIPKGSNAGEVVIQWERKKIVFPIEIR